MTKRSMGIRVAVAVAVLIGLMVVLRLAGGSFMTTVRRMHGHP